MLTYDDKQEVRKIVQEELEPINQKIDRIENNIDKVLKIVTRTDQEHELTKAKVNKHEKRLVKIEKKVSLKSPSESAIFA